MNKNPGIIGEKVGMTQIFNDKGEVLRCTVVRAGCVVLGKRTQERDGYTAVILGLRDGKEKHATKPVRGQFAKGLYKDASAPLKRIVSELRVSAEDAEKYEVGQKVALDKLFQEGQFVDAQGKSRGRGFTGVVRRWGFAGFVTSHGTHEYFRHGGSIGTNMTPGRTLPGVKMPGHYGDEKVSILNLRVAKVLAEDDVLLIEGGIPGSKNGVVTVRPAVKKRVKKAV